MKKKRIIFSIILPLLFSEQAFGEIGGKMKGSVKESIQLKNDGKFVSPLFSGSFKVIGIGLMKGQKLEKHQTPTAAFLYVQSGGIIFSMGNKKESLLAGDYFAIPAKEMHEVEASEDSKLMLVK